MANATKTVSSIHCAKFADLVMEHFRSLEKHREFEATRSMATFLSESCAKTTVKWNEDELAKTVHQLSVAFENEQHCCSLAALLSMDQDRMTTTGVDFGK